MATLIERDESTRSGFDDAAIDRIARQRRVTRRTVLRWRRGETQPSNRTRELTRRQALRRGRAQAVQVRSADGTFQAEGTIATSGSQRAVAAINQNLRRTRAAEIERARRSGNERALAAARARPTRLSQAEARDLMLRRERLVDRDGSGERPTMRDEDEVVEFYELEVDDSWAAWRRDFERQGGS